MARFYFGKTIGVSPCGERKTQSSRCYQAHSVKDFVFVRNVNFQVRVWFHIGTTICIAMYSSRQSSEVGSFIISQLCMCVTCDKLCLTHLVILCT